MLTKPCKENEEEQIREVWVTESEGMNRFWMGY